MTLQEAVEQMVAALQPLDAEIPELQVVGYPSQQVTPPMIDIFADTPFQEGAGFGVGSKLLRWVVRARVSSADLQAASATLYRLLDVNDPASVEAALAAIDVVVPEDGTVDGFSTSTDDPTGDLIGCRWRVVMYL